MGFFKSKNKSKNRKKVTVIVDEDFYPKNENPHLEDPFNCIWNGQSVIDVTSMEIFNADKEKYYNFYNDVREKYRKKKPSSRYHKKLLDIFKNYDLNIINLGIDESFERLKFKKVIHPKGVNSKLICSPNSYGCGEVFRFKEFNASTVCKNCGKSEHLKPNIDWFRENGDFEAWDKSKNLCENADFIIFIGSNCKRAIVDTLLNINPEAKKIEVARVSSDIYETEFHFSISCRDNSDGLLKLERLFPEYLKYK